jgi:hypothetical protein
LKDKQSKKSLHTVKIQAYAYFLNASAFVVFRTKNQFALHLLSALPSSRTGVLWESNTDNFQ